MLKQNYISIIKQNLKNFGFDIHHDFLSSWYNKKCLPEDQFISFNDDCFCILVANSKKVWPYFLNDYQQFQWAHDPFDQFCELRIQEALKNYPHSYKLIFSHQKKPNYINFQKIAHLTNFCFLDESYLCIHHELGPWLSLRALIIFNFSKTITKPKAIKIPSNLKALQYFNEAKDQLDKNNNHWHNWLKIRDSYTLGKNYRFCEQQVQYHYTKDINLLK